MKITLDLTTEQEAGVAKTVAADNRDRGLEQTVEAFLVAEANQMLDRHVTLWKARDLASVMEVIQSKASKLTDADREEMKALARKYDVVVPLEEKVEEVVEEVTPVEEAKG